MLLGALVLGALVAITHDQLPRDRSTWRHLTVAALVANAAAHAYQAAFHDLAQHAHLTT